MRQVKKGNQYYFGMKLHFVADAPGVVHSFHDVGERARRDASGRLLHGAEQGVGLTPGTWGCRSGYGASGTRRDLELALIRAAAETGA